jgi:hypothetical protein
VENSVGEVTAEPKGRAPKRHPTLRPVREVRNHQVSRRSLERAAIEGESPVGKNLMTSWDGAGAPKFSLLGDYYGPVLGLDCGGPLAAGMNVIR